MSYCSLPAHENQCVFPLTCQIGQYRFCKNPRCSIKCYQRHFRYPCQLAVESARTLPPNYEMRLTLVASISPEARAYAYKRLYYWLNHHKIEWFKVVEHHDRWQHEHFALISPTEVDGIKLESLLRKWCSDDLEADGFHLAPINNPENFLNYMGKQKWFHADKIAPPPNNYKGELYEFSKSYLCAARDVLWARAKQDFTFKNEPRERMTDADKEYLEKCMQIWKWQMTPRRKRKKKS